METTKEERERAWTPGPKSFLARVIRDVDALAGALGKAVTDGVVECDTGGHGDRHSPPELDECLACLGYTILESKEETNA